MSDIDPEQEPTDEIVDSYGDEFLAKMQDPKAFEAAREALFGGPVDPPAVVRERIKDIIAAPWFKEQLDSAVGDPDPDTTQP